MSATPSARIKTVLTPGGRHRPDRGRRAVDPLTHLLLGAIMQAGMVVARSDDPLAAKKAMTDTFAGIVSAL